MKYWKNGFYLEQDETNSRYEITDEYWHYLLDGENAEFQIGTDIDGKPILKLREITEEQIIQTEISELKKQLAKYKEDVEQVELFGMERADYGQKKARCAEIILELRELEQKLK